MQNEPNFKSTPEMLSHCMPTSYNRKRDRTPGENEPKTNPIRTQTNPISPPRLSSVQPPLRPRRTVGVTRTWPSLRGSSGAEHAPAGPDDHTQQLAARWKYRKIGYCLLKNRLRSAKMDKTMENWLPECPIPRKTGHG